MEEMDLNSEEFLEFAEEAEIESDTEAYEAPDSQNNIEPSNSGKLKKFKTQRKRLSEKRGRHKKKIRKLDYVARHDAREEHDLQFQYGYSVE